MKRRRFLQLGAMATAAPAVLPLSPRTLEGAVTAPWKRPLANPIRLSNNENPLGVAPSAREAITGAMEEGMNQYSFRFRQPVTEAIAAKHGAKPESIVLGNGSTEVNQMGIQAWLAPDYTVVAPEPTYEDATRYSQPLGAKLLVFPLTSDGAHDLEAMEKAARAAAGPVLFYVCNPNNPTATTTPSDDVESVIRRAPERVVFLVDEAYVEFAEDPRYRSLDKLALELPNVIVVRTFSKVYGMAGLRLGYAIAQPATATKVRAMAAATNTNHLALAAGLASLKAEDHVRATLDENRRAKRFIEGVLDELELERLPSHTNFLMHRIPGDQRSYIDRMREVGILVGRPFPPLLEWNRLSIGTVEEMEVFAERLREFRQKAWV